MSAGAEVVIVASGANLASLEFAFERLGAAACISSDAARIRSATHIVLPGVGAADEAMRVLGRQGLDRLIPTLSQPVLGICLGFQLLHQASEEGEARCLGLIEGTAVRFREAPGRPVPHMGWNTLCITRGSRLLDGLRDGEYFYFVHSYALPPGNATVATSDYGQPFSACVEQRNYFGVQFHPERSAAAGARILENFLAIGSRVAAEPLCA